MRGIYDIELRFVARFTPSNEPDGSNAKLIRVLQWRRAYRDDGGGIYWEQWADVPLRTDA